MLTIGKSNYLRFNNPAEALLLKSTIGSNDRISMAQIDFTQNSSCSSSSSPAAGCCDVPPAISPRKHSNAETPDDILQNLHDILNSQSNYAAAANNGSSNSGSKNNNNNNNNGVHMTKNNLANNMHNFNHSPKVFAADSVTVNAPAKDVLGTKFNSFTKNLTQIFTKNDSKKLNGNASVDVATGGVLTKVNNVPMASIAATATTPLPQSPKVQQFSACYDRYPKPGSYGQLQVFPMNGVNSEMNQPESMPAMEKNPITTTMAQTSGVERQIAQKEHDLEDILRMCADFNRVQSSPIVQNRIKTNGSLPRDKKPAYIGDTNCEKANLFFPTGGVTPSDDSRSSKSPSSGYENVKLSGPGRKIEIGQSKSPVSSPRYVRRSTDTVSPSNSINGYENVQPLKKPIGYIPQSPRTKIKTCVSPKKEATTASAAVAVKKSEYDALMQSFEDKLRLEIQMLRDNKNFDMGATKNGGGGTEQIYGTLEKRNKNINNLTLNIGNKDPVEQLLADRKRVLVGVRQLKTQISDLQRQEEEVLREVC